MDYLKPLRRVGGYVTAERPWKVFFGLNAARIIGYLLLYAPTDGRGNLFKVPKSISYVRSHLNERKRASFNILVIPYVAWSYEWTYAKEMIGQIST